MPLDHNKIKIYRALINELVKLLLVLVAIGIFTTLFIHFIYFITEEKYKQALITGGSSTLFAIIITMVYKHYFKTKKT